MQATNQAVFEDLYTIERSASLADLKVGESRFAGRTDVPRHTHERALLFSLLQGTGGHSVRGATVLLEPGMLSYVPAGEAHELRLVGQSRIFSLELGPEWLAANLPKDVGLPTHPRTLSHCRALAATLRAYRALRSVPRDAAHELSVTTRALVLEVACGSGATDFLAEPAWLQQARAAISARASSHVDMTSIAAEVGVHPVHLSRTFRRVHGIPASRYLRERRLELATQALLRGGQTISMVAVEAGFTDHAHFSRVFRETFQFTPSELVELSGVNERRSA